MVSLRSEKVKYVNEKKNSIFTMHINSKYRTIFMDAAVKVHFETAQAWNMEMLSNIVA